MDDFVPDRTDTTLEVGRNNETVVSGMTDVTYGIDPAESSAASYKEAQRARAEIASSLPSSKFRGGTARRFGGGGSFSSGSGSVGGGSIGSKRSAYGQSKAFRGSQFAAIAEEMEGDEEISMGATPSVGARSGGNSQHRTTVGDDNSIWMGSESASVHRGSGGVVYNTGNPTTSTSTSVASSGRGSYDHGLTSSVFGGGMSRGFDDNASAGSTSSPHGEPDMRMSQFSINDDHGDGFSVMSGLSHQRSIASQFHRSVAPPPPVSGNGSVVSSSQRSVRTQPDRPSAPYRSDEGAQQDGQTHSPSNGSYHGAVDNINEQYNETLPHPTQPIISQQEQTNILLSAYDNTRLPTHQPKVEATEEVNVALYQEMILDADELSALPEEYVLDDYGNRFHPKDDPTVYDDPTVASKRPELEMLSPMDDEPYKSSPFAKNRRWSTLITIAAAVTLAIVGICMAARSLKGSDSSSSARGSMNEYNSGGYVYLPGYQFGGGIGGLVGGTENERRMQLAYGQYGANLGNQQTSALSASDAAVVGYAPAAGGSSYTGRRGPGGIASYQTTHKDPYGGFGPPQFNPQYSTSDKLPTLSSTPLTSYAPPPTDGNGDMTIVLDSNFNGAFMELSSLPYNPHLEIPVVLDVHLSGGTAIKSALGRCLKFVQCSEEGNDILNREYDIVVGKENGGGYKGTAKLQQSQLLYGSDTHGRSLFVVPKGDTEPAQHNDLNPMCGEWAKSGECKANVSYMLKNCPASCDVNVVKGAQDQTLDEQKSGLIVEAEEGIPFNPPLRTEVVFTSTYVNVDCTTSKGINRGVSHNLATSDMAPDVIYSSNMHDTAQLFAPPIEAYGRSVVVIRDPMQRSVAKYRWLMMDGEIKGMSLMEFAHSDYLEDNALTRAIASNYQTPFLGKNDLAIAKEILKRKFVVGLFDRMEESIERFETFFGWHVGESARACQQSEINQMYDKHFNHNMELPQDPTILASLQEKNRLDIELYEFARTLYDYQGRVLFGIKGAHSPLQLQASGSAEEQNNPAASHISHPKQQSGPSRPLSSDLRSETIASEISGGAGCLHCRGLVRTLLVLSCSVLLFSPCILIIR